MLFRSGFNKPFSPKNTPEFRAELSEFLEGASDRLVSSSAFIEDVRWKQEDKNYWESDIGQAEAKIVLIDALIKNFGIFFKCEFALKNNIVLALEKLRANKHLKRLGLTTVLKNEDSPEKDCGC